MKHQDLISPLDNRYSQKIIDLANNFSESNLNKTRFEIEIDWIIFLTTQCGKNFKPLSSAAKKNLLNINGNGNILLQEENDNIKYNFSKSKKNLKFDTSLEIEKNPFHLNFLNYTF